MHSIPAAAALLHPNDSEWVSQVVTSSLSNKRCCRVTVYRSPLAVRVCAFLTCCVWGVGWKGGLRRDPLRRLCGWAGSSAAPALAPGTTSSSGAADLT